MGIIALTCLATTTRGLAHSAATKRVSSLRSDSPGPGSTLLRGEKTLCTEPIQVSVDRSVGIQAEMTGQFADGGAVTEVGLVIIEHSQYPEPLHGKCPGATMQDNMVENIWVHNFLLSDEDSRARSPLSMPTTYFHHDLQERPEFYGDINRLCPLF